MTAPATRFEKVSRHFGDVIAVDQVDLEIGDGEFFSMLGPSGSGKTTCLRMIAGFDRPTSGHIYLYGQDVSDLPPYERDVNTVFQDYALFPHMTVEDNIAYGLMVKGVPKAERYKRVDQMLDLVRLPGFGYRKPSQLSGGQRQRVALARALINHPKVLLLDEPLGALDLKLRQQMQVELKNIQREVGITFIFVTHDQEEALTMSDRLAVMNDGRLEQVGTPDEVYESPATPFVYHFLGDVNVFHGRMSHDRASHAEASGQPPDLADDSGEHEVTFVRPHDLELSLSRTTAIQLEATVQLVITAGSRVRLELTSKDSPQPIAVELTRDRYRELKIRQGDVVFVHPKQLQVFRMPGPPPV